MVLGRHEAHEMFLWIKAMGAHVSRKESRGVYENLSMGFITREPPHCRDVRIIAWCENTDKEQAAWHTVGISSWILVSSAEFGYVAKISQQMWAGAVEYLPDEAPGSGKKVTNAVLLTVHLAPFAARVADLSSPRRIDALRMMAWSVALVIMINSGSVHALFININALRKLIRTMIHLTDRNGKHIPSVGDIKFIHSAIDAS
ncbi:hypothetical protein BV22DRAFT_1046228 [Leucogyrophana mollusca]|uniref:Uncharacterized protein n=1 Tax=Leucogyrophana mollusca TaxID=85980 RepID=A0ACB8BMW1_9AGAM|nr:hypothetical protein BV22DRAFT_1046228 [Leucogyrophana mollusca]